MVECAATILLPNVGERWRGGTNGKPSGNDVRMEDLDSDR